MLCTAGASACFLSSPYSAKLTASTNATQGTWPYSKVSHTTARAAMPTATHWSRRNRSDSTMTPRSTLTSGLV